MYNYLKVLKKNFYKIMSFQRWTKFRVGNFPNFDFPGNGETREMIIFQGNYLFFPVFCELFIQKMNGEFKFDKNYFIFL